MANLDFPGRFLGPEELVAPAAPQALTANWVDMGAELFVQGAGIIVLWVNLDINGSTNARVRLLVKRAGAGADEYVFPIITQAAATVQVEDHFYEFNVDADQLMVLPWELDGAYAWCQFQVQAGAVGAPAATIDSAYVTTGIR